MMRTRVILPVLMAGLFGVLWGCTPPAPSLAVDKSHEARIAKLEQELKSSQDALVKTGALYRLELARTQKLERERDELHAQLKLRTSERDNSLAQLKVRTHERDNTIAQFDSFRKNIKELLGQADAASGPRVNENSVTRK